MFAENEKQILFNNRSLFWDVDVDTIDLEQNAHYIIERFLEYGTLEGIRGLRKLYGDDNIKKYIVQRGYRTLSNKTLNYWTLILNLEGEKCLRPSLRNSSRRYWNY